MTAARFDGRIDRDAVIGAVVAVEPLVTAPEVAQSWHQESALPGWSVGGLARHLVSQPECAVEFLALPVPAGVPQPSLRVYADALDWLDAAVDAPENTSIRDDFDAMAAGGAAASVAVLQQAAAALPDALAAAGPLTFVPWQQVALATDDFLVMRLLELVVHADDLAVSVGVPTPEFDDAVTGPVVELLGALALRRHASRDVVRALSRAERSSGPVSAF